MWIIAIVRIAGLFAGILFLVLLLVAMPLKYFANMPLAVSIVGGMHGVLFVAYIAISIFIIAMVDSQSIHDENRTSWSK